MNDVMKVLLGVIAVVVVISILAGIELWTQVGRYQAYWNKLNQQPVRSDELLYVALGDSTAQGIGASRPQKGYVGLIAEDLSRSSGKQVHVMNFSKTGAKVEDVLNRQLALAEKLPDIDKALITMEIGANDMADFKSDTFERTMDRLMSKLPKQTVISDIPYFGGGLHRRLEPNVNQANEIMYRLATKHGFSLAPLHAKTFEHHDALRDYAIDRFHPSNHNYRTAWAPAFLEQLQTSL